ncbi:hypothetical protein AMR41_21935 [Hapalosiphon sp. MRB220]|nr:hypothetical protein AMR41_21935 [Hapalosiphon sp. MRB220]
MKPEHTKEQIALHTEIAHSAIAQYDFDVIQIELLKHSENTTFKLATNKGDLLLRVHRGVYCTIHDIECEAKIIDHLRNCKIYSYQQPIRNRDGNFVSIGTASGTSQPVSILSWIDHQPLNYYANDLSIFVKLGELIANIHNQLATWDQPNNFQRPILDTNGLIGANGALGYAPVAYSCLDNNVVNDFQLVCDRLIKIETKIGRNSQIFGLIHADLHLGNALWDGHSIIPIDFDDSGWGYYIYDLAVPLAKYWATSDYLEIKTNLLAGYRSHRELSIEIETQLPLFIAARFILGVLWLVGRAKTNLAVREDTAEWTQMYIRKVQDILNNSIYF